MKTYSIIVSGRVQDVYYRKSTKEKAIQLGLTGTVQNLKNGAVAIVATGLSSQLDELLRCCKIGPTDAIVDSLEFQEVEMREFTYFEIIE